MSNHTPGPWKFGKTNEPILVVGGNKNDYIATVRIHQIGGGVIADIMAETRKANARLIAASPELLEACVRAHDALLSLHVCNQDNSFANEIRTLLKATIAKATD